MASATSTPLARRKKQTVYGKSSNTPFSPAGTGFFEDDETAWAPAARTSHKPTTVMPTRPATVRSQPAARPQASTKKAGALPKAKRTPPRVKDTYDVPSDDEATQVYSQIPFPPKQRIQSRLLDEPEEQDKQLAPWEKNVVKKTGKLSSSSTKLSSSNAVAKATEERLAGLQRKGGAALEVSIDKAKSDKCEPVAPEGVRMTAMQKLAARRKQAQSNSVAKVGENEDIVREPPKRSAVKADSQETPQIKRRRMTPQPSSPPANTIDSDSSSVAPREHAATENAKVKDGGDIFDVPSDEEPPQPQKSTARKTTRVRQRTPGAGMLRRVTPQKGLSAPSRLEDMLISEDGIDARILDHDSPGTPDTPQTALRDDSKEAPSTPIPGSNGDLQSQRPGTLTPKQTQLWADLFEPAVIPNTDMKKLSITEEISDQNPKNRTPALLQRSSSDVPVRRTRIVDRLKASAPNSSDEESEDEEDRPSMITSTTKPVISGDTTSQDTNSLSHASTSQDRATKPAASGSLITYSQQRSILADDNIESALMLDIPMEMSERPVATARRIGRPATTSRTTSYVDDDLDEAPTGGLRTIHELRAGGRNARIMGEIEDLLGEIRDHATSARSRRRGALLDLATKLLEKTFAEQIINHGLENALLDQCKAPNDPPADFLLATALLLILHAEPPKQSLDSFGQALPHVSRLLGEQTEIVKVVKERRSNMSRSAQGDIAVLSDKLKADNALWGEIQPTRVSSRVVALKIIEIVVRRLREAGDRSELLASEAVDALTPKGGFSGMQSDSGKAFEASLVISIMEALKTRSAADSWPDTSVAFVAALPAAFAAEWQAPAHTKWLTYRLCANITNESSAVRSAFVRSDAVRHLMADVVTGLETLQNPPVTENVSDAEPARDFDNLVLAIGTLINLTEHSTDAQKRAVDATALPPLTLVVQAFLEGQKRAEDAESVEQSAANVAYGYLSIMLANLCQDEEAKQILRSLLPGGTLRVLVAAVGEFVQHHQRVDGLEPSGPDSEWSSFTDRLMSVLIRLKAAAGEDMEGVQS